MACGSGPARQIDHLDIPLGESAEFLRKAFPRLMAKWGILDLGVLALARFRLRD
jgi:type III restriction enzyme